MATYAGADKRLEYLFENGGGGGTGGAYYHADWIADSSSAEDTQLTDIVNIYNAGKYLAVITMPAISSGSDTFHVKLSGFSDITPQVFTGLGSTAFIFELTSNDVPRTIDVRSFLSTSATWTNKYKGGLDIFCLSSVGGSGDPTTFAGLTDVDFSNLQNGQIPKYNSTTLKWENGKANISEAGDVNLNNVQNDQILVYDSVLQKWKNANQSGGGGGTTVIANPSGAATGGDLLKLQVGNVIYSIPSGGGGGRSLSIQPPAATDVIQNSAEIEVAT